MGKRGPAPGTGGKRPDDTDRVAAVPIGLPPPHLSAEEMAAWSEIVRDKPYITARDRGTLEVAARLMAADRAGEVTTAERGQLLRALAMLDRHAPPLAAMNKRPNRFNSFEA
jgi:hypothetical protein